MYQGNYNGAAIQIYTRQGRDAAWQYINSVVPERFRAQVISAVKLTAKRVK